MQSQFPYHVTARCLRQDWFSIPMDQVWTLMAEQLYFVQMAFGVRVMSFVLMPSHFHMILQTPDSNLGTAMSWFMRETSRSLARGGKRINQSYAGRYFRSVLSTERYFIHAYKFVYSNPKTAGIVDNVLDYRFSSLPCLLGHAPLPFPVFDDQLWMDSARIITWLNQSSEPEDWEAVRRALRRKIFQLPNTNKLPHRLEEALL